MLFIKRRENRLTQKQVASQLAIHKQTYYLKEIGKADFTLKEVQQLSKILNTSMDELFPIK